MKQKVIRIIKRLIGHRILVHPIVDANVYDANENSFSGNSLQDSNVLIVGCDETLMRSAECYYKNEGCYYKPQNKMFHFCKTFCSKITLVNTIQNVI